MKRPNEIGSWSISVLRVWYLGYYSYYVIGENRERLINWVIEYQCTKCGILWLL